MLDGMCALRARHWGHLVREAGWIVAAQVLVALAGIFALRPLTVIYAKAVFGVANLLTNGAGLGQMLLAAPLSQAGRKVGNNKKGAANSNSNASRVFR